MPPALPALKPIFQWRHESWLLVAALRTAGCTNRFLLLTARRRHRRRTLDQALVYKQLDFDAAILRPSFT